MTDNLIEVIPAIIPTELETLNKFSLVKGAVKKVQIDFVDGKYLPAGRQVPPPVSWPWNAGQDEELSKFFIGEEKFPFLDEFEVEADLFVSEPLEFLNKLITIGFKNFVIHMDSTDSLFECLEKAKAAGGEVGVGIKPSGDFAKLEQYLNKCDFVQFMGNDQVGYNGVGLDETVLEKIKTFHAAHPGMPLQIDIGVNFDTAKKIVEAGVTRLVSGSTVFESELPPREAVEKLLQ